MVRQGGPDSPKLAVAGVWLIRVRAPSQWEADHWCAITWLFNLQLVGLCAHIVSEITLFGGTTMQLYCRGAGGCGCAEKSETNSDRRRLNHSVRGRSLQRNQSPWVRERAAAPTPHLSRCPRRSLNTSDASANR
eukprot:9498112-Pyramimonas_sp.AAC.1